MNVVESIEIDGFWGTPKKITVAFDKEANFIIGKNGTGKTTIINILASSLKADIGTLYSISFDKIKIILKDLGANKKPVIDITKTINLERGSIEIVYEIRLKTTDSPTRYVVEGPFEERLYRDMRYRSRRLSESMATLENILNELVQVNFLSVHRGSFNRFNRDDEFATVIDKTVADLSARFSSYFSLLSTKINEKSKQFQEFVFLKLLEPSPVEAGRTNLSEQDKTNIIDVLIDLGVSKSKATRSVNSYANRLKSSLSSNSLTINEIGAIVDSIRMDAIIGRWKEIDAEKSQILYPKSQFEKTINGMFSGKEVIFDERNMPHIKTESRKIIDIKHLSSGEKQLFILLGEALLQESKAIVFISDEPELSLHIQWQSELFLNIRKLNPLCQIITATHSPDIVGNFQNKILKIEDCVQNV